MANTRKLGHSFCVANVFCQKPEKQRFIDLDCLQSHRLPGLVTCFLRVAPAYRLPDQPVADLIGSDVFKPRGWGKLPLGNHDAAASRVYWNHQRVTELQSQLDNVPATYVFQSARVLSCWRTLHDSSVAYRSVSISIQIGERRSHSVDVLANLKHFQYASEKRSNRKADFVARRKLNNAVLPVALRDSVGYLRRLVMNARTSF